MTDWTDDEIRQIVVGFDTDWQSRQWLLDGAAQEAERRGVAMTIVTVRPRRNRQDMHSAATPSNGLEKTGSEAGLSSDGVDALRLMYPLLRVREVHLDEGELTRDSDSLRGTELLVIGSRGRFDQPAFASGSMSHILLEALACPVLLIPAAVENRDEHARPDNDRFVLVGIGNDSDDLRVARAGLEEASRRGCNLHMLFSHPATSAQLDQPELSQPWNLVRAAATGSEASTSHFSVILTSETPAAALAHHAMNAAVVVIGSRPGSLLGLVPDSVSHAVLTSVRCPVLVVPRNGANPASSDAGLATAGLI